MRPGAGLDGRGIYLTSNRKRAEMYARSSEGAVGGGVVTEVLVDTDRAKVWDDDARVDLRKFAKPSDARWIADLLAQHGEAGVVMGGQNARIYLGWVNDEENRELRQRGYQAIQRYEDFIVLDPSIIEYDRKPMTKRSFQDVGHVGEHWGHAGSGFLFMFGNRALLLKRSSWVMEGGTWGIPGGAIPHDQHGRPMATLESAKRETREEIGTLPKYRMISKFVFRKPDFVFTTFVAEVSAMFEPKLNDESDDYVWISLENALERLPLHPGVRALIENRGEWDR